MAYIKVYETSLTGGKSAYTSEILTNKYKELINSGDVRVTSETLSNGNRRDTETWRDEAAFNSYLAWVRSSGENLRISAYNTANNITTVVIP